MYGKDGAGKIPAALTLGLVVGMMVTVLGAMITASLIYGNTIDEANAGISAMVTILVGSSVAALVAASKAPQNRLIMCLGGAFVYYLGLICCAAVVFDGATTGLLPALAVVAAGAMAVFLLGMKRERRPKYRLPKLSK